MSKNNFVNRNDSLKTKNLYANIGKLITSSLDLDDILTGIMKEVQIYFDPQYWSLLRLDDATKKLFFCIYKGENADEVCNITLSPGEGIAGTVAQSGESVFVPDTSKDPRFSDKIDQISGIKTKSVIAVPLVLRGKVFGVIEIINRINGKNFTDDEHLVLKTIADFSAIAFSNANLYEQVISMSITDHLTGLYNHSMLNTIIDDYESKGKKKKRRRREKDTEANIIVVYTDLDEFKSINDNFGHREGDKVLKKYAKKLRALFRKEDLIIRIGGDEFIIIINFSSEREREEVIERIVDEMSTIKISSKEKEYSVSVSFGIAWGAASGINQIIHKADMNMYHKKRDLKGC